jgi:hypothetical protein
MVDVHVDNSVPTSPKLRKETDLNFGSIDGNGLLNSSSKVEVDNDLSIATKYEEFQHPNMEKRAFDINEG